MPPRANWKGYVKLSLVTCSVELFPPTSDKEKVSFHLLNGATGHRLKQQYVDAETGAIVDREDQVKGYEVGKGDYVAVSDEELPRSRSKAAISSTYSWHDRRSTRAISTSPISLDEEKKTDQLLTRLAETNINQKAA